MREPFAKEPRNARKLILAFLSWQGTPFHEQARVKGVGVDCIHLIAEIMKEAGAISSYTFPKYEVGAGHHTDHSKVREWFENSPDFAEVIPVPDESGGWQAGRFMVGDVLGFLIGRTVHHIGMVLDTDGGVVRFGHVMIHGKVREAQLDDPAFGKRLACVFRPMVGQREGY